MDKNNKNKTEIFPDKNAYKPLDFFVIRTPALAVNYFYSLAEQLKSQPGVAQLLNSHEKIATALAVGNPSFYEAIMKAVEEEKQPAANSKQKPAKDSEKIIGKLVRVLTRMSTRPTPFGLYAGIALGKWDEKSNLSIKEIGSKSRSRLDMELLTKAALGLEKELLPRLHLVANPTLRQFFNRLYLLEKAPVLDEKDVDGSWLEATEEVIAIVEMTQQPISYESLLKEIAERFNMYEEDTQALIEHMVENTYLLTSLRPNTFDTIAGEDLLELTQSAAATQEQLKEVIEALHKINSRGISGPEAYLEINEKAKGMFDVQSAYSLQTDMPLTLESASLNKSLGVDLSKYADVLARIGVMNDNSSPLRDYKEQFLRKYEIREVPILELLNQDFGLGFPQYGSSWSFNLAEYNKQIILDELVSEAIRDSKLEVQIAAETLEKLLTKSKDFNYPISIDLFATVLADSQKDIDEGNYSLVNGGPIAGAGRSLGRFADMLGDEALADLKSAVKAESVLAPNEILAELSSLPRTFRLGNVCTVPIVRPYHIVLDSWPGLPDDDSTDEKIALNDLLVGLENNKFYLRSVKHGARVRINSPSMMNPLFKTQIARFLTAITDDANGFAGKLPWGTASDAKFRPRVRFEKFILSPAHWSIRLGSGKRDEFSSPENFKKWLSQWRERWFVPRYVQLVEFDNVLLIDLDNDLQTEELRRELANQKNSVVNLQESFCSPEHLWVTGPGGKYVSEIVASFVRAEKPELPASEEKVVYADPNKIPESDRVRCPGNEWIYFKLYLGKSLQDDLIAVQLSEFIESVKVDKLIMSWFFIKYEDPEPHIRVRFLGDAEVLVEQVYKRAFAFCNQLVNEGICTKFVVDSYNREVERYGGLKAIGIAEQWFSADSQLIAKLLRLELEEGWSFDRQMIVSLTVDLLVDALGLNNQERSKWYRTNASRTEYGDDFRQNKEQLHFLFNRAYAPGNDSNGEPMQQALFSLITEWLSTIRQIGKSYRELQSKNEFVGSYAGLCASLVHMHCNRYLGTDHKAEMKARTLAWRSHEARTNRKQEPAPENELVETGKSV